MVATRRAEVLSICDPLAHARSGGPFGRPAVVTWSPARNKPDRSADVKRGRFGVCGQGGAWGSIHVGISARSCERRDRPSSPPGCALLAKNMCEMALCSVMLVMVYMNASSTRCENWHGGATCTNKVARTSVMADAAVKAPCRACMPFCAAGNVGCCACCSCCWPWHG